ncbi:MAG: hypothetical protein LLG04_01610 [Parachlamydia sp.]|nr:hypothetical protein [Parachlamydia sp.]
MEVDDLEGKIHFRDKWQFELKTKLYPFEKEKEHLAQEFYFFISSSLQINDQTYSKEQFYQDQTNLIRLKLPMFTFKELLDPHNDESPLMRILLRNKPETISKLNLEIKLFGGVFHSSIRTWALTMDNNNQEIEKGCRELERLLAAYRAIQVAKDAVSDFRYVDEYISLMFDDYILPLLSKMPFEASKEIRDAISREDHYRKEHYLGEYPETLNSEQQEEYLLYRKGILSKIIIAPLVLKTSRSSVDQRYRFWIAGIPAAIAMLIFLIFYLWGGFWFFENTQPFILFTVMIYVLKDRIKEELRFFSYRKAAKWFSDYSTDIQDVQDGALNLPMVGVLREYATFIEEEAVPADIKKVRNRGSLEDFKRAERVLYYKKSIYIKAKPETAAERF